VTTSGTFGVVKFLQNEIVMPLMVHVTLLLRWLGRQNIQTTSECDGLNENSLHRLCIFEYLVPSWWNCLGRIRRYGLVGGMLLGGGVLVCSFSLSLSLSLISFCSSAMPAYCQTPNYDVQRF
jgi:hypothetical protein